MLREIDRIRQIASVILSGILLSLAFPPFNLGLAAYFAFLPLFFALKRNAKKEAFLLSYVFGLAFFAFTLFWLRHVSILGYILLILILSILFGVFGLFFLSAIRYPRLRQGFGGQALSAIFVIPAFWVILEYIRSNFFSGFGWALLGHSQYQNLPLIQISDITGAYGVSFLVMMVNVIIYSIFCNGFRKTLPMYLGGIFIVCSVLGYGYFKLNDVKPKEEICNISLIQGNIPQAMKWDPQFKTHILDVYDHLTRDASRDEPDLIIWPETALPGFIEEKRLFKRLETIARDVNTHLLIGAPSYGDSKGETIFNSAFLISKEGEIVKDYDKLHLVPFGEYIPFGRYTKFLRDFIDKPIGDFVAGNEYTIFELKDGIRFGVLICFEDIFSNLVRNFVLRGADFMVNITNDAWFMKTGAPYQHAQSSVFRAVENRVPVVRAANTGLSCFINKYGKIIGSVKLYDDEIFVAGYKTKKIGLAKEESFYSRFGDLFTFLCITIFIIRGVWRWSKRGVKI